MSKLLSIRNFILSTIRTLFELDEVNPKLATEKRIDERGKSILGRDDQPRYFNTEKIVGYRYVMTMLNGRLEKSNSSYC